MFYWKMLLKKEVTCSILVLILSSPLSLRADVTLPSLLSNNMVLQQNAPVHIWGKASAGEAVTVEIFDRLQKTKADENGNWQLWLHPIQPSKATNMTITGNNTIVVKNILIGEVWFAAGQSNMEWSVRKSLNSEQEIANANFPEIRIFDAKRSFSDTEQDDIEGQWVVCSPETVAEISGAGYFFTRGIHQHLNLPVGLIDASWGATRCEAWSPSEVFEADQRLQYWPMKWEKYQQDLPELIKDYQLKLKAWEEKAEQAKQNGIEVPRQPEKPEPKTKFEPSVIYNGVVSPIKNYTIKGVIWYQGENNAYKEEAFPYRFLFPAMIDAWRKEWKQGDFPFIYAQLSTLNKHPYWPVIRESQTEASKLKNTAMVVTYDVGDSIDAHFKNKQVVGKRFELAARKLAYGEDIIASGPLFKQMTIEGDSLRIWFYPTNGLVFSDGVELVGFEIAGENEKLYPAKAIIDGKTLLLYNENVANPKIARYAFKDAVIGNLVNEAGLPAVPFRTDVKDGL